MRFGQDEFAFLKPDENGGLESGGESEGEGGDMMEMADPMVVYDHVEDNKNVNKTEKKTSV